MTEVGGDVAFYFDPLNVEDLAAGLKKVVDLSEGERGEHIGRGRNHARTFTWAQCLHATVNLIKQLL
jgi:glycosyltransferase involved in cell wall biosynthesis